MQHYDLPEKNPFELTITDPITVSGGKIVVDKRFVRERLREVHRAKLRRMQAQELSPIRLLRKLLPKVLKIALASHLNKHVYPKTKSSNRKTNTKIRK